MGEERLHPLVAGLFAESLASIVVMIAFDFEVVGFLAIQLRFLYPFINYKVTLS